MSVNGIDSEISHKGPKVQAKNRLLALGLTHLAKEAASVATHRCLAPNHPVFRLLAPHYFYLFAINV